MSYENERKVLNNWAQSKSFWGLTPFGLDTDDNARLEAKAGAGYHAIAAGQGIQSAIGAPRGKLTYPSIYSVVFWVAGGSGQAAAKAQADTIINDLINLRLDEDGNAPTPASEIVYKFGEDGALPYIAELTKEANLIRVRVEASFTREQQLP